MTCEPDTQDAPLTSTARRATRGAGAPESAPEAPVGTETDSGRDAPGSAARAPRSGTKQALLIGMLCAERGATIAEIAAATGWQAHTVRGAIAGALKKKLGLDPVSAKVEGRGRVYRLPPA